MLVFPAEDMLSVIDQRGKDTEELFGKSNYLLGPKEKLASGEEMSLIEKSVIVMARVLQVENILEPFILCIRWDMKQESLSSLK